MDGKVKNSLYNQKLNIHLKFLNAVHPIEKETSSAWTIEAH